MNEKPLIKAINYFREAGKDFYIELYPKEQIFFSVNQIISCSVEYDVLFVYDSIKILWCSNIGRIVEIGPSVEKKEDEPKKEKKKGGDVYHG